MKSSSARKTVVGMAASAVALGAVMATASSASAVNSSACTRDDKNHWAYSVDLSDAPLREGPGNQYRQKGTLEGLHAFYVICSTVNGSGNRWYYGDLANGTRGWLWGRWING
ncbi:hypothetical protein [Streptomyces sp. NPDC020667]|uniref:hypothetical protein n=1 Tax=Streptomyces sp. NPDC020667 TaxID=3154895 RepID=UPI0033EF304E